MSGRWMSHEARLIRHGEPVPAARISDGAPLVDRVTEGPPPVCGRCGVEWYVYCVAYMDGGGGLMDGGGGLALYAPRCGCWRLGTAGAVKALGGA